MLTDMKGLLARIDPDTNRMVAEIQVPTGSSVVVLGEDKAIWVVSTQESKVVRIDPNTNLITDRLHGRAPTRASRRWAAARSGR
jgi:DNA-binding beta-propeller fold protein YncE